MSNTVYVFSFFTLSLDLFQFKTIVSMCVFFNLNVEKIIVGPFILYFHCRNLFRIFFLWDSAFFLFLEIKEQNVSPCIIWLNLRGLLNSNFEYSFCTREAVKDTMTLIYHYFISKLSIIFYSEV